MEFRTHAAKIAEINLRADNKGWIEFDLSDTVRAWAKDQNNSNSGAIQIKISDSEGKISFPASLEN